MQHKLSIKFRKLRKKGRPKRLGGLGSKQVIEGRPEMKTRVDFDVRSGRSREGAWKINGGTGRDGPNTNTACAILVTTISSSLASPFQF